MKTPLKIRDFLLDLVLEMDGFSEENAKKGKRDAVEKFPFACVYLDGLKSEIITTRPFGMDREQTAKVSFFIHQEDAEAEIYRLFYEFEKRFLEAKIEGFTSAEITDLQISHDPDSNGMDADGHLTINFNYTETNE